MGSKINVTAVLSIYSMSSHNQNQTALDQGLRCLSFRVHLSSALVFSQTKLFKVQDNYINVFACQLFSARSRPNEYTIGICLERAKIAENSK